VSNHFTRLEGTSDWHILKCPLGHYVDRDYASVMNMMWKTTLEAWTKGVWWGLRKRMDWGEYEDRHNPLVPYGIVILLQRIMRNTRASLERSPAMLTRGTPMNPARGANEDWARTPPRSKATPTLQNGEEASQSSTRTTLYPILL